MLLTNLFELDSDIETPQIFKFLNNNCNFGYFSDPIKRTLTEYKIYLLLYN